jgi:hypothetical protein
MSLRIPRELSLHQFQDEQNPPITSGMPQNFWTLIAFLIVALFLLFLIVLVRT